MTDLNLSDLTNVTPSELEGASYDAAVDSLTKGQRNKLLGQLGALPEQVKASPQGTINVKGIGWIRATFGLIMLAIGWIFYAYGLGITYLGKILRMTAERILQQG